MVLRFLLMLLLIPVCSWRIYSQPIQDDVVYLKNGTFLRGKVVEQVPGKFLRMTFHGKDTLEIQMGDVTRIKKENTPEKSGFEDGVKAWGYTNITELSFGYGYSEGINRAFDPSKQETSIQISTFNGFTLSPYIQLGVGVGLEFWNNRGLLPIYIDLRANMFKTVASPFLFANAGYSPGWMAGVKGMGLGGAMAAIGLGARFNLSSKLAMVFSLGYRFQQIRLWQVVNLVRSKATLDANFFVLRAGVMF